MTSMRKARGSRHDRSLVWLLVLAAIGAIPALASDDGERPYVAGRLFLKLRAGPGMAAAKSDPILRQLLGSALETARPLPRMARSGPLPGGLDRLLVVQTAASTDIPALAAKLSRLPVVEYAEPVFEYEIVNEGGREALAAVPNDPAYGGGQQAYLANLQVEAAWDVMKSENGIPRPIVCIVDGGTNWQHEDLGANIWSNPGEIPANSIDDDGNGFVDDIRGWNFRDNNNNPRGNSLTPSNANHGTHTGGLAAAVTHNAIGAASASWNPVLMPVNASGNSDGSIAYGYDGIVYAAENGADVVSLSWGGSGGSFALQDIIDFATAAGTLVIAAAGNGNTSKPFYPAAYNGVLAVANVLNTDVRYGGPSASNYGGWLDVAAPGAGVYSTFDMGATNAYGLSTGTSMSCPVAAAVAALVAAQHPTWTALEVGEQVRISCDNINAVNPGFVDLLGRGRVNAHRAVTVSGPAIRATSWTFADANANGELNLGENVIVTLTVHNYLATAMAPSYALSSISPHVTITDGTQAGSTLVDDGDATLTAAFAFTVSPTAPLGTKLDLRLDITALGYADFQFVPIVIEPLFETHDVNAITVSLTSTGGIGWIGFPSGLGDEGVGFSFQGGQNVLFEGALLLGTGPTRLSDAARLGNERTDFAPVAGAPGVKLTPGPQTDQEIRLAFTDSINTTTPLGVRVDVTSWAMANSPNDDFILMQFDVRNRNATVLDSLWAGLFFDWDIDESHFGSNRADYDASRQLGYAWDPFPGLPYVGVLALSGATVGYSAIPINGSGAPFALLDGFSKAEKWEVLQAGTGFLSAGPTDVANALSSGPYRVPVGGDVPIFFALIAGSNLADLQANADRARIFFADSVVTDVTESGAPPRPIVALGPATPNPFNPTTRFELVVAAPRRVRVTVHDARGRQVATLADRGFEPGRHVLAWNGRDDSGHGVASGVYFARLDSGAIRQTRRIVLAK